MKLAIKRNMIYSKLRTLIAQKEQKEQRKVTYKLISAETGLSSATLAKLLSFAEVDNGVSLKTIDKLCNYFKCPINELLEFVPDDEVRALMNGLEKY